LRLHCIKRTEKGYIRKVISITGASGFTKIIMENLTDKIKILPCDFFCCGSGNVSSELAPPVPETNNSYIKHRFTGSWH